MPSTATATRVTLLKGKHGDHAIDTPRVGLLQIEETDAEGAITKATFHPKRADGYDDPVTLSECEFIHLTADHKTPSTDTDTDTAFKGLDGPFDYWEDDHTALVHVLWSAKHDGLSLQGDADEIARMILRSRWLAATKARATENALSGTTA